MDFNELVQFYERISKIQGRLEIIKILSELFDLCKKPENKDDLKKIIYLTQGRLVAEIKEWPKFGVAEKMVIQAMVKFTGNSAAKIKKVINKKGDAGEAVQNLLVKRKNKKITYSMDAFTSKSSKKKKKNLQISRLYRDLKKLSETEGEGSQDQKINIINGILRRCSPLSAKYIINIILSNLRIGVADMTILDSLSISLTGTKKNRPAIEQAYNVHPDLGNISEILLNDGFEGIKKIGIEVGTPIRMMLASRIQYTQIQKKLGGQDFIAEYKYDGERVQIHKKGNNIVLFSRQLKNITEQYPDVVEAVQKGVKAEDAIFEGEIVAMDHFFEKMLPFQVVSTRRRKHNIQKIIEEVPVCLFCFDVLYIRNLKGDSPINFEGNIMKQFISERRKCLESLFNETDRIRFSSKKIIHDTQEMVEYFEEARNKGAEGIMNKKIGANSIYEAGKRSFLWIKLKGLEGAKMVDTIDVVIIGASWGKGRRKGLLSTFFGAVFNQETDKFEFLTRVGSGFTDTDLEEFTEKLMKLEVKKKARDIVCNDIPDVWFNPEVVIELFGDELTESNKADAGATLSNPIGYGLRFPVFQRTRMDKEKYQITTTKEILRFYELQSKV